MEHEEKTHGWIVSTIKNSLSDVQKIRLELLSRNASGGIQEGRFVGNWNGKLLRMGLDYFLDFFDCLNFI